MSRVSGFTIHGDEELVYAVRRHVFVLFWPVLGLLIFLPAAFVISSYLPYYSFTPILRLTLIGVAALATIRWSVWPFLQWWSQRYALTTKRLVVSKGVLRKQSHEIPWARITDVRYSAGVLQRLLRAGDLTVESGGEWGQLLLPMIPTVTSVRSLIFRLVHENETTAGSQTAIERAPGSGE